MLAKGRFDARRQVGLAALALITWLALTPGLAEAASSCALGPEAVGAAAESLIAADNRRDLEAVLDHYTDEAILLPPSGEVVRGKEAIGSRYRALFEENLVEFTIEIGEAVAGGDDWAFVRGATEGTITPLAGGAAQHPTATFLMILHCEGGAWKVHRLSWSDGGSAGEGD